MQPSLGEAVAEPNEIRVERRKFPTVFAFWWSRFLVLDRGAIVFGILRRGRAEAVFRHIRRQPLRGESEARLRSKPSRRRFQEDVWKRARFSSREPNGRPSKSDRVAGLTTCFFGRESRRMDKKSRRRCGLAWRRNRFRVRNLRRRTLIGALRRISRRDAGLRNDVGIHLERSPRAVKPIQDGRGISYTTQTSRTFLRFPDFRFGTGLTSEHSCEEK